MTRKIITTHIYPPIPTRQFDWCAYLDGEEENTHRQGWGATESEAIDDLNRVLDEEAEAEATLEDYPPGCTCRLESVDSASIDPPEKIRTRGCPHHWPIDPDRELQRQEDDKHDFPEINDHVPF